MTAILTQPDYTSMDSPAMLSACRDDAAKWAAAFCQHAKKLGHDDIDEGWMIGWFANAIEQSHAIRVTDRRFCACLQPGGDPLGNCEICDPPPDLSDGLPHLNRNE